MAAASSSHSTGPVPSPTSASGDSLAIVVVGASGDLAKKKTFPALYDLFLAGLLPKSTIIWGYARSGMSDDKFLEHIRSGLNAGTPETLSAFLANISYFSGGYDSHEAFARMSDELAVLEGRASSTGICNRIFYLAVPPTVFVDASASIKASAMSETGWTRVVVEKPFGHDSESSRELSRQLAEHLREEQIYRIDHYLGKEMVQNLLIARFANTLFEPLWNAHHVANVQITFKEPFGTEGRGGYFDGFGIIRDVMQNHLLQVLSLVAMEPPVSLRPEDIRDEKVKVLRCIPPITLDDVVIGQYTSDAQGINPGYLDDKGVSPDSVTPTFATAVLHINNPRWYGVPFILKCGKALNERKAEIRIQLKHPPNTLFRGVHNNEIVLRIGPSEAMWIKMNTKLPGLHSAPVETEMDLTYKNRFPFQQAPEAYARLILDVIRGDHGQFVRSDELEAAWGIFTPLLHKLERERIRPFVYPFGSRGPPQSDELVRRYGYEYDLRYSSKYNAAGATKAFEAFKDTFRLSKTRLLKLLNDFLLEMERGLAGEESSMKMITSYVTQLATGTEAGRYYAVDLGGSNLRVVCVELDGAGGTKVLSEIKATIPIEVMKGHADGLFDFIAGAVKSAAPPAGASLGFTFSFPVAQTSLKSGTLIHWTKGFESAGVVGKDVVALLEAALAKQGVDVNVVALVNDTVGTLMAKAYSCPACRVGVILGTGTNGAYVERAAAIGKWSGDRDGFMVINMEWGGFGSGEMGRTLLPVTGVDSKLDSLSPNPTKQRYEKMISGMYLGELTRIALEELTGAGVLTWGGTHTIPDSSVIKQPWKFPTALMARIAVDESAELSDVGDALLEECKVDSTVNDRKIVQAVCESVAKRAARLCAVGIAACVVKMGVDAGSDCVAGIDGSVFTLYPKFPQWIKEALVELDVKCVLEGTADGSGLGAAVIAAVSSKL